MGAVNVNGSRQKRTILFLGLHCNGQPILRRVFTQGAVNTAEERSLHSVYKQNVLLSVRSGIFLAELSQYMKMLAPVKLRQSRVAYCFEVVQSEDFYSLRT